jgi:hypothetical protein
MMRIISKSRISTLAIICATLSSCTDNSSQSDTDSIDNFANAASSGLSLNSCRKDQEDSVYDDTIWGAPKNINKAEVVRQWMSDPAKIIALGDQSQVDLAAAKTVIAELSMMLPLPVGVLLFQNKSLGIELGSRTLPRCEQLGNESDANNIGTKFSCWYTSSGDQKGGLGFSPGELIGAQARSISLEESIRHSYLRNAFYLFFHSIKVSKDPAGSAILANMNSIGERMVDAFLEDLSDPPKKAQFESISREDLKLELYVEALDSTFCSRTTHDTFKTDFPKTYAVFSGR